MPTERQIHKVFQISLVLKGLNALVECIGGVALFLVSTQSILSLVAVLTQSELIEDPNDAVANYLLRAAEGFSIGAKQFAAIYLLSHGVVKLFLVAGLLRDKAWAYPASLAVLGLFIVYQVYRFVQTEAPALVILTVFDAFVIALIWHEYRLVRRRLPHG